MIIKKGDKVKVDYVGSLENGKVFDSSIKRGRPLEVVAGSGQLIKGFDDALIGMSKGETKTVTIPPEQAYGSRNPELVRDFPRTQFPADQKVEVGMMVAMHSPDGGKVPAVIKSVSDDKITVDVNHPLAEKTLVFKITIVEIEPSEEQKE